MKRLIRFLGVGAGLLLAGGCSTAPTTVLGQPSGPAGVRLQIVNVSDYLWRVGVVSSRGDEAYGSWLPARESLMVDLAGGDYDIVQTVMGEGGVPGATRRFSAQLEAGQTYRWPLVTLLSEPVTGGGP